MLRSNNISSISIACSEYERELLVEAKEEYPELKINCWFYRFNRMEEILQESFQGYLRAIDRPINAITIDFAYNIFRIQEYFMQQDISSSLYDDGEIFENVVGEGSTVFYDSDEEEEE